MKTFFISSTFKDMQAERDMLHQIIFPELSRKLRPYGEDIQELDLRWGVDTSQMSEEESGYHVVESCVDAIDRCKPYMIVLIGERYGWIPDSSVIQGIHDERIENLYMDGISITQMEILYGALEQEDLQRCIFCFRKENFSEQIPEEHRKAYAAESVLHAQKLSMLKEKIRSAPGAIIMEYEPVWDPVNHTVSGLENFSDRLSACLWEMLQKNIVQRKSTCYEEQIWKDAQLTMDRYMSTYIPRNSMSEIAYLYGRKALWFYGEPGAGKSAYMASLGKHAQGLGYHVFLYFCGNANCASPDTFIDTLFWWLCQEYGLDDVGTLKYKFEKVEKIKKILETERKCDRLILIDGIDQIQERQQKFFLYELTRFVKAQIQNETEKYYFPFVISSTYAFLKKWHSKEPMASAFKDEIYGMHLIGDVRLGEIKELSQSHARRRGKRLDHSVLAAIKKKEKSVNPFYLSLVLQLLFMMDQSAFDEAEKIAPGMEGLSRYMVQKIEQMPDDPKELALYMFRGASDSIQQLFSNMEKSESFMDFMYVLKLLAVSEEGLTLHELENIIRKKGSILLPMVVERFFSFLYDSFTESSTGHWNFSHRLLRESILEITTQEEAWDMSSAIGMEFLDEQMPQEAFYYVLQSGNHEGLNRCMEDYLTSGKVGKDRYKYDFYRLMANISSSALVPELEKTDSACPIHAENFAVFLTQMIQADVDSAMKYYEELHSMLLLLEENKEVSVKMIWQLKMCRLQLCQLAGRCQEVKDCWHQAVKLFPPTRRTLDVILSDKRYRELWGEIPEYISGMTHHPDPEITVRPEDAQIVIQLLSLWERLEREEPECGAELQDLLHRFVDNFEEQSRFPKYRTFYAQRVILADWYACKKKYKSALSIVDEVLPWYQVQESINPDIEIREQYAALLHVRALCYKPKYAVAYIREEQKLWKKLQNISPQKYFLYREAYDYGFEHSKLSQQMKSDYDMGLPRELQVAERRTIETFQEILDMDCGRGKDETEIRQATLEHDVSMRESRVSRRLKQDIWNWRDDRNGGYLGIVVATFCAQMEEDLQKLEEETTEIYRINGDAEGLWYQLWDRDRAVRYYDMHQEKEKAFRWCQMVLDLEAQLQEILPEQGIWDRILTSLDVAECYQRYDAVDKAVPLAERVLSLLKNLPQEKQRTRDCYVRSYLLLIKGLDPQEIDKAQLYLKLGLEYWKQSEDKFYFDPSKAETKAALDELAALGIKIKNLPDEPEEGKITDQDFWKSDLFQSVGELLLQSNRREEAVEYLQEANACVSTKQNLSEHGYEESYFQKLFRFLTGEELLGRLTKDKAILERTLVSYRYILKKAAVDERLESRPLLQQQMLKLEQFYGEAFPGEPLPEDLQYILTIADKKQEEKIQKMKKETKEDVIAFLKRYEENISDWRSKGDIKFAIYQERSAARVLMNRWEEDKVEIPLDDCWSHYCSLREERDQLTFLNNDTERYWREITDFGIFLCRRFFDLNEDIRWLRQIISEAETYCKYLLKRKAERRADLYDLNSRIRFFSETELEVYRRIYRDFPMSDEEWIYEYQRVWNVIIDNYGYADQDDALESMDFISELREAGFQHLEILDELEAQVSDSLDRRSDKLKFYEILAKRNLGEDASSELLEMSIQKMKDADPNRKTIAMIG
jgi:hypothetical protein